MKIALAAAPFPQSIDDSLTQIKKLIKKASAKKAEMICFPESYIPGMRGTVYEVEKHSPEKLKYALDSVCQLGKEFNIYTILPMDWAHPDGIQNLAFVISNEGKIIGKQTKNHLDPREDNIFIPGKERNLFEFKELKFGISICYEGFRIPETVRWSAYQGAHLVFHPHFSGNDFEGQILTQWGGQDNPYYEKAVVCRALENNIYIASINYAMKYQKSATCVISPTGECIAWLPYGKIDVLLVNIEPSKATRQMAKRFKPELYY